MHARWLAVAGGVPKTWSERFSDFRPSVSPDGTKLLFDRYGATEPANHDLYVRDLGTGAETRLTDDPGYDSDGRWSPDGGRLVFHSDRHGSKAYDTRIYVMRADGSDLRRVTAREASSSYPAWSPDGARIVHVLETEAGRDLWTVPLEGGVEQRLTDHPGADSEPAWSPDAAGSCSRPTASESRRSSPFSSCPDQIAAARAPCAGVAQVWPR